MADALSRVLQLVADDTHAVSFQSLGQYRLALMTAIGKISEESKREQGGGPRSQASDAVGKRAILALADQWQAEARELTGLANASRLHRLERAAYRGTAKLVSRMVSQLLLTLQRQAPREVRADDTVYLAGSHDGWIVNLVLDGVEIITPGCGKLQVEETAANAVLITEEKS